MAQAIASSSKLVFVDENRESVKIWLDPSLPSFADLAPLLRLNGAVLARSHVDAAIIVLYSRSKTIFDQYCHPAWLNQKERLIRGEEEWEGKVILSDRWPRLCVAAGRMVGASENWGECRHGGPPKGSIPPTVASAQSKPAVTVLAVQRAAPSHDSVVNLAGSSRIFPPASHQAPARAAHPSTNEPHTSPEAAVTGASTRFPPRSPSRTVQYTDDELDEIFRNAHPMCLWQGIIPKELGVQLYQTYPKLSAGSWSKMYAKWLAGAGRFKPLATETGYFTHVDLFQPYLPDLQSGTESLTSLSDKLEKLHSELGKSSTEWNILLGGWVRNISPNVKPQTPPPPEPESPHPDAFILRTDGEQLYTTAEIRENAARRKVILAKEFKAKYDLIGYRTDLVGKDIASRYGYLQSSVQAWYCQWRTRDKRFEGIPDDLQPTAMSAPPGSTPTGSTHKRRALPAEPVATKRAKPSAPGGDSKGRDLIANHASAGKSVASSVALVPQAGPPRQASDSLFLSSSSEPARLSNTLDHYNQSYTAQKYDEILRNAHPLCFLQGKSHNEMGKILTNSYPKVTNPGSWLLVYQKWLSGTRKFQPLLQQKGYLAHIELFEPYLVKIRQGATLVGIATELAKQHPEHNSDMWNVHLGDWVRNMPFSKGALASGLTGSSTSLPFPSPSSAPPSPSSAPPSPPAEKPPLVPSSVSRRGPVPASKPSAHASPPHRNPAPAVPSKDNDLSGRKVVIPEERRFHVLAEMFKRDYDETTWSIAEVGREVAKRTGHKALTCEAWFGHWLHNDRRYREVDDDFRPARPRPSLAVGSTSSSSIPSFSHSSKRTSTSSTPSRTSSSDRASTTLPQTRKHQGQFTDAEEAEMVGYIHARQPLVTEAFEEDWEDFASKHGRRPAGDYAEHHRIYKARMNDLLVKLGGHVEGRRSSSFNAAGNRYRRLSSSTSTMVATPTGETGTEGKEREVVDLTMSDDDD